MITRRRILASDGSFAALAAAPDAAEAADDL